MRLFTPPRISGGYSSPLLGRLLSRKKKKASSGVTWWEAAIKCGFGANTSLEIEKHVLARGAGDLYSQSSAYCSSPWQRRSRASFISPQYSPGSLSRRKGLFSLPILFWSEISKLSKFLWLDGPASSFPVRRIHRRGFGFRFGEWFQEDPHVKRILRPRGGGSRFRWSGMRN